MKSIAFILIVTMGLAGCSTSRGPKLIQKQRIDYNEKFVQSEQEQMLTNLVRLRYHETPVFLQLSSIVTQYTVDNSANAGSSTKLTFSPGTKTSAEETPSVGASVSFQEKPTVTYVPLQGEEFAKRFLTPIPAETIFLLSQSGWSISRLLSLCVQSINEVENASSAAGPTPQQKPKFENFQKLVNALRALQKEGVVRVKTVKADDKTNLVVIFRDLPTDKPGLPEHMSTVRKLLGLTDKETSLTIKPSALSGSAGDLALDTRSLLGVLFFMSHAVRPPVEHVEKSLVTMTRNPDGTAFNWDLLLSPLLSVKSQKKNPADTYVKVKYRDYWYFIADSDRNSKNTFSLLSYLFALQSAEGSGKSPLLTISS